MHRDGGGYRVAEQSGSRCIENVETPGKGFAFPSQLLLTLFGWRLRLRRHLAQKPLPELSIRMQYVTLLESDHTNS